MVLKIGMGHLRELFPMDARLSMQHSVWVKQYNNAASDREVLDELYEITDGDHWFNKR